MGQQTLGPANVWKSGEDHLEFRFPFGPRPPSRFCHRDGAQSIPFQPPLLLARGERRSARDTQRSRTQRARKQARAFWWGARSALGTDNPATEYVAPAPSSSRAAHAPVTNYLAPIPDVTFDCVAPAPVMIGYIAPARAAPCSRDFSEASTPMVVGSPLRLEGFAAPFFSQVYQEQIIAGRRHRTS